MKKFIAIITLVGLLVLGGCGQQPAPVKEEEITTINMYQKLVDAGLPVSNHVNYTEETDPNGIMGQPGKYIAKLDFEIDNLPQQEQDEETYLRGGSIEIFANAEEASNRKIYIDEVGSAMPIFREHSKVVFGRVLIRIDYSLSEDEAERYFDLFK